MRWEALKVWLPILGFIVVAFVVTFQFVEPPPPNSIRIATGPPNGAYAARARDYATFLAREQVKLEIVESSGSVENLELLQKSEGGVDVAFVQGGVGDPELAPHLVGLASLYYEPLWVFVRSRQATGGRLGIDGTRLAIGVEGSGTNDLVTEMLRANGLLDRVVLLPIGGEEAADALRNGDVDYMAMVAGEKSALVQALIHDTEFSLVDLDRASAFARQFRFLSTLNVPEGAFDLTLNIPPDDLTLVAPAATLVARSSLHPALAELVVEATFAVHSSGDVLSPPGAFPSLMHLGFPASEDAERYFTDGPSLLQRYLPFWIANLIQRWWILIIPFLTILIPLIRIAPPIYQWRMKRHIYRRYQDLGEIERDIRAATDPESRRSQIARLDELQAAVGRLEVPLAYAEDLYHLRTHIELVKNLLEEHRRSASGD